MKNNKSHRLFPEDDELYGMLVYLMTRTKPEMPLAVGSLPLAQQLANGLLANFNGLNLGDLRYAPPVLLELVASCLLGVGEWRDSASLEGMAVFKGELHIAMDSPSSGLFDLYTRDFIVPEPMRSAICASLGLIDQPWIREAVIEAIRANHRYLSLFNLLSHGSPKTLLLLGKIYRGISIIVPKPVQTDEKSE